MGDARHYQQKDIHGASSPSEYAITELGKTLIPLIEQLEIWGDSFRPEMKRILKIE